jgi:hypothetical protein
MNIFLQFDHIKLFSLILIKNGTLITMCILLIAKSFTFEMCFQLSIVCS